MMINKNIQQLTIKKIFYSKQEKTLLSAINIITKMLEFLWSQYSLS